MVWTTLQLTVDADGTSEHHLTGASGFPRHWLYGVDGHLEKKAGLTEFGEWYRHAFGKHTPWGDEDSPTLVTEVETAWSGSWPAASCRAVPSRRPAG